VVVTAQNRTAVDPGGNAFFFQRFQIPANGFFGNLEFGTQSRHYDLTGGPDPFRDYTASFCSQQTTSPPHMFSS
jgi:hypothetical protein